MDFEKIVQMFEEFKKELASFWDIPSERKVSIGKDWHPECLRCEECGKRLNPGQHAEHKGVPYCHVPCYGALFGPQLFGHGTRVESHKSYGAQNIPKQPALPRDHLEAKIKLFNEYFDKKSHKIKSREVNGRLVFEGQLRVYWGVAGVIHLKEELDQRTVVTVRKRNSWRFAKDLSSDKQPLLTSDQMTASASSTTLDHDNDTTISESLSYDTLSLSSDIHSLNSQENSPLHGIHSHPRNLDIKDLNWEEIDETLQVDNKQSDGVSPLPSSRENSMYHSFTESSLSAYETDQTSPDSEEKTPIEESSVTSLCDEFATPQGTLKPTDFEQFGANVEKEYIFEANLLPNTNENTLKLNQPIDPARINDSLKLYGDSMMTKSISEATPIQVLALPKASLITGTLDPIKINDTFSLLKQNMETATAACDEFTDNDPDATLKHPLNLALVREKLEANVQQESDTSATITPEEEETSKSLIANGTNYNNFVDSDDDSDTETLKAHPNSARTIYLKMDCYDELNPNGHAVDDNETVTSPGSYVTKGYVNEDGVVLRKPPKSGSTAIKRRSGNRRSRTKLKRRCSINGHYYNRDTSVFTPPRGSQMSVWVTSLTNTQEIVNLLLEKYKVESKAENFTLFIVKDNGEQRRLKDDEFPLVTRIMLGPHEEVARLFLMDSHATPEISNAVAQFLNLSIPELQAILAKYSDEEERELNKIKFRYADLRQRIQARMESLKVRL